MQCAQKRVAERLRMHMRGRKFCTLARTADALGREACAWDGCGRVTLS